MSRADGEQIAGFDAACGEAISRFKLGDGEVKAFRDRPQRVSPLYAIRAFRGDWTPRFLHEDRSRPPYRDFVQILHDNALAADRNL